MALPDQMKTKLYLDNIDKTANILDGAQKSATAHAANCAILYGPTAKSVTRSQELAATLSKHAEVLRTLKQQAEDEIAQEMGSP